MEFDKVDCRKYAVDGCLLLCQGFGVEVGIHRSFHVLRPIEHGGAPRLAQTHELSPRKVHLGFLDGQK